MSKRTTSAVTCLRRGVGLSALLLALLATSSFAVPVAGAELVPQTVPMGAKRIFAPDNKKIDIDGIDDKRVDADVAVLDVGVNLNHPDLNVVEGADCLGAVAPEYKCTSGPGDGDDEFIHDHGTGISEALGAIDNDIGWEGGGGVGIAAGVRIWAVDGGESTKIFGAFGEATKKYENKEPWEPTVVDLNPIIGGVKWVTENADKIEVLELAAYCRIDPNPPTPEFVCGNDKGQVAALEAAIEEAIKAGVVVVTPAGNWHHELESPMALPEVIVVSAIFDSDGLAGGKGPSSTSSCGVSAVPDIDDTSADASHFGSGIDIASPGPCTSGAAVRVSASAAILASRNNPSNDKDVKAIGEAIFGDGDCAINSGDTGPDVGAANCNWTDESGDGVKEPLLDVSNETVFDPLMVKQPRFAFKFGSSGTGNGQFAYTGSPSVDAAGNIWVPDTFNGRIEKFNSKGEYLSQFGKVGSGNGEFSNPVGSAIDSAGNLWIADSSNGRLQKFDSTGKYLSQFGKTGAGTGEFKNPTGVAIDSAGNIWVADRGNNRVQKFDSSGKFLLTFGKEGTGNGEFKTPTGIAVDSTGNVWVVDPGNNRVQKFDSTGKFLLKFGEKGSEIGQLDQPNDIDVDSEGNPWVTDIANHRVQGFNSNGQYRARFGAKGTGNGQFESPVGIAVDSTGGVWVTDSTNLNVQRWRTIGPPVATTKAATVVKKTEATLNAIVNPADTATQYQFEYGTTVSYGSKAPSSPKSAGSGGSNVEVSQAIEGLENNKTYHFRVVASNETETVYGADETFTTPNRTRVFAGSFSLPGEGKGAEASSMAMDPSGNHWVGYAVGSGIEEFSFEGKYLGQTGGKGSGHELSGTGPKALAFDFEGDLWVSDGSSGHVAQFNSKGEYLSQLGSAGSGNGQLSYSEGIAIDSSGNLWVSDTGNDRIEKFGPEGEYLSQFGSTGSGNGKLNEPSGIAIDSSGNLWVSDTGNDRIQVFSPEGVYMAQSPGGDLSEPRDIAIDSEGNTWVADTGHNRLAQYSHGGVFLGEIGENGFGEAPLHAVTFAIDSEDNIWVANATSKQVEVWSLLYPPMPPQATTEAATEIEGYSATFNGTVNPNGGATKYLFQYGKTTAYGSKAPLPAKEAGSGTSNVKISEPIVGLTDNTTYHYRIVARRGTSFVYGEDKTLTTPLVPDVFAPLVKPLSTEATLLGVINPRGVATTYWFEYGTTLSFGSKIPVSPKEIGSGTSGVEVKETLTGLTPNTLYYYRLYATNGAGTGSSPGSFKTYKALPSYSFSTGSKGGGNGQFEQPYDVATDSAGNAYVSDVSHNRIEKFNSKGEYVLKFGGPGSGNGKFNGPAGVDVDSSGNIWVVDSGNNRVQKFNSSGEYVSQFGSAGTGNGQFSAPTGISVWGDYMAVVDTGNNRVQTFRTWGEFCAKFGSSGSGNSQFSSPHGVFLEGGSSVYVADTGNNRIQKHSFYGTYLGQFGTKGTGNGQLEQPHGVAVDSQGAIWVADSNNHRIQEFNSAFQYLGQLGTKGSGAAQFETPTGVAVDSSDHVWAVDYALNRMLKW